MEPPLSGGEFLYAWDGLSVGDLFDRIRISMPPSNPNGVSRQEKADIISYLKYIEEKPAVGGLTLGSIGPVAEGLFIWVIGLGAIVGLTVWVTAKSN